NSGSSSGSTGSGGGTGQVGPILCYSYVVITGTWEIPPLNIETDPPVPDNPVVATDPATTQAALVGTPTFFWNLRYDGTVVNSRDITGTQYTCPQGVGLPGPEVAQQINLQLHYWVIDYTWTFGDGQQLKGWCGSDDQEAACTGGALG